ncbi:SapC family protein [Sulfurimonas sp.]
MLANIFKKPEILDKIKHKDLKLSPYENYEFTKDVYLVPIGLEEMLVATKSLIIVFVKDPSGAIFPSVVLGGENGGNLLLSSDYSWKKNTYIPAALRSYPFGLGSGNGNNYITVDTEADVIKTDIGNLLVKDESSLTKEGDFAVKFVTEAYSNIENAKAFTSFIDSFDILKLAEVNMKLSEEEYIVKSGIYIVDENSLNKLESRKLKKLSTGGYMKFIYAHLLSLSNKY